MSSLDGDVLKLESQDCMVVVTSDSGFRHRFRSRLICRLFDHSLMCNDHNILIYKIGISVVATALCSCEGYK